jgi:hypothetical protein
MKLEISSGRVNWDQGKWYNEKNGSEKISLDCPFKGTVQRILSGVDTMLK